MLGRWLTAERLDRQMVRGGERGHVVVGAEFDPEPLTGGLERGRGAPRHTGIRKAGSPWHEYEVGSLTKSCHLPDDQLIEIVKPHNRTPWLSSEQFAAVPRRIVVRVLRYRVERKGARSRDLVLMTTLLDKVKYPASDIAELYKARWQVELNLRDLKQTLGMNSLHSKSVDGVTKEMLMFALVYNAVCAVMNEAARRQCVAVDRISFIDALRWLRNSSSRPDLPTLKVNPRRADRLHPRMLKRRLRYTKLQVAREIWRQKVLSAQLK